jgi:hypothetical protein
MEDNLYIDIYNITILSLHIVFMLRSSTRRSIIAQQIQLVSFPNAAKVHPESLKIKNK